MAAGGPGDHPITDILNYNIEVYGKSTDSSLMKLSKLLSRQELYKFWESEVGFQCEANLASEKIQEKLTWATERAKENGWEN